MRLVMVLGLTLAAGYLCSPGPRSVSADEPKPAAKAPSFKDDIKPILAANCTNCHGTLKRKAGIDLQAYSTVMKAVKAGEPDASRLVKALHGKGAKPMPPKRPLDGKDIDLIKA